METDIREKSIYRTMDKIKSEVTLSIQTEFQKELEWEQKQKQMKEEFANKFKESKKNVQLYCDPRSVRVRKSFQDIAKILTEKEGHFNMDKIKEVISFRDYVANKEKKKLLREQLKFKSFSPNRELKQERKTLKDLFKQRHLMQTQFQEIVLNRNVYRPSTLFEQEFKKYFK